MNDFVKIAISIAKRIIRLLGPPKEFILEPDSAGTYTLKRGEPGLMCWRYRSIAFYVTPDQSKNLIRQLKRPTITIEEP